MDLVLNTQSLRPPLTGIGNYTFHLLDQLAGSEDIGEVHCFDGSRWMTAEETLRSTEALRASGGLAGGRVFDRAITRLRGFAAKVPGAQSGYARIMERRFSDGMRRRRGAIYHETNYIFMPCTGPCVTTVHDLSYISHASFHPQNVIDLLESKLPETIRRADRIITDSNVVRDELLQHFAIPDEKVRTVYLGADEAYRPRTGEQTSAVLADYGLSHGQYVLLTATLEPRKGIDTLLDAWAMLPETLRRAFPLVLTGSAGWRNGGVLAKLSSLLAEGTVHYLGYVPAEVLPVLFSGAAVFTYPSVYEGFGLPVLEAMSSGVPVVCRDGTAMAEFAQGSCVLCVDGHAAELSANIEMLLNDEQVRAAWAEKGLRQARKFSWQRCAAETVAVYREVL